MVALLFPWPSAVPVTDDAKGQTSPRSTVTPVSSRSRSASEAEEPEVAELSSLDEEIQSLENAQLKAEIDRLARRNLDLRMKLLAQENAFLRARIAGQNSTGDFGEAAAPCFPPGVWMDSSLEEAQLCAMAAWTASEPLQAKRSRTGRRKAARRKVKVMWAEAAAGSGPSHNFVWDSSVPPFQPQGPPGLTIATDEDEEELVVALSDSSDEEEEEEDDSPQ